MCRVPQSLRSQSPHKHQEKESLPLLGLPTPEQRAATVFPRRLTGGRRVTAHALTLGGAIADAALTHWLYSVCATGISGSRRWSPAHHRLTESRVW